MSAIRRRIAALAVGIAVLVPTAGVNPANAIFFAGTCELKVIFRFSEPIGFGTLGNPSYTIRVEALHPDVMACQITDKVLDPLRHTGVTANGTSSIWDCDSVLAAGGWSQSWWHANGSSSPAPVNGGYHKVVGTWDNWVIEAEGPNVVNFASVIPLRLDPTRAANATLGCATNSLTELHTIGTQVFQDPKV